MACLRLPNGSYPGSSPIKVAYLEGYHMSPNCQVSDYSCRNASYSFVLMAMVSKLLNLDIEYVTWKEGGWAGVSDFLLNGFADMSIPFMPLYQSAIDKVDFLPIILRTAYGKFVFHRSSLTEHVFFHWETVLSSTLWWLLVLSTLTQVFALDRKRTKTINAVRELSINCASAAIMFLFQTFALTQLVCTVEVPFSTYRAANEAILREEYHLGVMKNTTPFENAEYWFPSVFENRDNGRADVDLYESDSVQDAVNSLLSKTRHVIFTSDDYAGVMQHKSLQLITSDRELQLFPRWTTALVSPFMDPILKRNLTAAFR